MNSESPANASDRAPSGSVPTTSAQPKAKSRMGLDEKLYLGFIGLGLAVIGTFLVVTILRVRAENELAKHVPDRRLREFSLIERSGRQIERRDLDGQLLVVNFVFTSCAISCLQVNHNMTEIQRLTAEQPNVRLVSLSVDPGSDTPASLAKFAKRFQADTNRWLFLTGARQILYPLIETSFLGPGKTNHDDGMPIGMIHSDQIAVMDGSGRLRGLFNGLRSSAVMEVTNCLAKIQSDRPIESTLASPLSETR